MARTSLGVLVDARPVPEEDRTSYREVDVVVAPNLLVTVRKSPPDGQPWQPEPSTPPRTRCLRGRAPASRARRHRRVVPRRGRRHVRRDRGAGGSRDRRLAEQPRPAAAGRPAPRPPARPAPRRPRCVGLSGGSSTAGSSPAGSARAARSSCSSPTPTRRPSARPRSSTSPATSSRPRASTTSPSIAENQNDVGKKLTVIASLLLTPTLIVGFYGQNFGEAFQEPYWTIGVSVFLIVVTALAQLAFFKWRRWI